ncbi:MAG: SLBB domain-containing protein, partial [Candidatus Ratteibacteria bacterium]
FLLLMLVIAARVSCGETLKVFGQDFFSNINLSGVEFMRFVPEKYYLGPGDQIEISVWGVTEFHQQMEIDREGSIIVPRIGKIYLSGKNLIQARKYLQDIFSRTYRDIKLELTLVKARQMTVFVMGEVVKPGTYAITTSTSILEILALAGGITERGSMRKISIVHKDGTKQEIDLYPVFFGYGLPDITMQAEDIVYVPLGTKFVSITGAVRRPAIYEMTEPLSLKTLIEYAGGFLPEADTKRIAIFRNDAVVGRKIIDIFPQMEKQDVVEKFFLNDGDQVEVSFISKDVIDCVFVEGVIKNPGKYGWKQGLTVSDIVKESDFLPETSQEQAEIIRESASGAREIIQFSLLDAVRKIKDIELKSRDRIVIRSKQQPVKTVTVSGEVKFPGQYVIYPGEKLSSVIQRAGGFTPQACLPAAVFTRVSVRQREKQELEKFIMEKQATIEKEAGRTESEEEKALIEKSKTLLQQLAQTPVTGRIVVNLEPWEKFAGSESDLTLENGDSIHIPTKPTIVSVVGEVNHSTNILYRPEADIKYYIEKAGSFTKNADTKNIFIVKVNGSATNNLKKIDPGDVIVVGFLAKDRPGKIFKDILQALYYVKMIID